MIKTDCVKKEVERDIHEPFTHIFASVWCQVQDNIRKMIIWGELVDPIEESMRCEYD